MGIGDWGLGPIPNPQSPIPNPQSPIPNRFHWIKIFNFHKFFMQVPHKSDEIINFIEELA